ncbi:MAG: hypothetical protein ACFB16_11850 [Phormidesmis sp.]
MNRFSALVLVIAGIGGAAILMPRISHAQSSHTGTVESIWKDGFRLKTGARTLRVDSWYVYGDATAENLSVGDRVTITGEFDVLDFDADSITDAAAPAESAD